MGKHFLSVFPGEDEYRELEPGLILSVKYDIARVIHHGNEIYNVCVTGVTNIYVVSKEDTFALKLYFPNRDEDAVAWLIGIWGKKRAHDIKDFNRILEENRRKYKFKGYKEHVFRGENFTIIQSNREDGEGVHNIVAYIKKSITNEEILDLVPLMVFPLRYIQFLLQQKFGINPEEVERTYNEWK